MKIKPPRSRHLRLSLQVFEVDLHLFDLLRDLSELLGLELEWLQRVARLLLCNLALKLYISFQGRPIYGDLEGEGALG